MFSERLRKKKSLRDLVKEFSISSDNLVMPYFVVSGKNEKQPIKSMPGIFKYSVDNLIRELSDNYAEGARVKKNGLNDRFLASKSLPVSAVLLFAVSAAKDETGTEAYNKNGIIPQAVRKIKKEFPDIVVITDVCLCGYTSHGHCGILRGKGKGERAKGKNSRLLPLSSMLIDNDATIKLLSKIALSHAEAGADIVAPSAMADGQVLAIRKSLDKNGFKDTAIMGYSAKYASSFYLPFRDVMESAPKFGNRHSYQMDWRNLNEALREIRADIEEGADIVMVKPALAYLDVIRAVKENFNIPLAAYSVSGEYSMVKNYCLSFGTEMERDIVLEILTGIKRAGADIIITYWAKDIRRWLS